MNNLKQRKKKEEKHVKLIIELTTTTMAATYLRNEIYFFFLLFVQFNSILFKCVYNNCIICLFCIDVCVRVFSNMCVQFIISLSLIDSHIEHRVELN